MKGNDAVFNSAVSENVKLKCRTHSIFKTCPYERGVQCLAVLYIASGNGRDRFCRINHFPARPSVDYTLLSGVGSRGGVGGCWNDATGIKGLRNQSDPTASL